MSNVGKGARQLWYDKHYGREEKLSGSTLIKFMFGELTEQLLLFLVARSGHSVENSQAEVALSGIKGHIDCTINDVVVDVKSASPFGFKKFKYKTLTDDGQDAFGYTEQISGYSKALDKDGAFLAMDKVSGELAYMEIPKEDLAVYDIEGRLEYLKAAMDLPVPPERCYPDVPHQTSGNMKLDTNCSYCDHKKRCWQTANGGLGLREFIYSNGPVWLTKVVKEPNVYEKTF